MMCSRAEKVWNTKALIITLPDWAAPERRGMTGAEQARQQAVAKASQPVRAATPSVPTSKAPYVGVTARMADPAVGRRVG